MFSRNFTGRPCAAASASAFSGPPSAAARVSNARIAYSTLAEMCTRRFCPVLATATWPAPLAGGTERRQRGGEVVVVGEGDPVLLLLGVHLLGVLHPRGPAGVEPVRPGSLHLLRRPRK